MTDKDATKSKLALKEEEILNFWEKNDIFKKSLEKTLKGKDVKEFVFYEGPPTANGMPAIHHLEARAFKDVIPRYKTMQGFHVQRKAGWDTHGLPVELAVEKELGLTSKKDIEKYGVDKFNKKCRESVLKYIGEWDRFTERMGYWVDREDAYFTCDNSYIEGLWKVVKKINDQKLLYKDYKVVPWCPRCGTGLSSHELAQGYQDVKDLSVYAKFKVKGEENTFIVAWTTTPWTLPGNVALAIGEKIDYVKVKAGEVFLILAKQKLELIEGEKEVVAEMKGKDLVGMEYEPLYPFLSDNLAKDINREQKEALEKAFKVYPADFVTTDDGTGVVHTAVMYGTDDFILGTQIGLPKFHLVKEDGHFISEAGFLSGKFVKDEATAVDIIKDLHGRGLLFKKEKYEHSYPHCWRCKTPLIYFARDSWYIRMSSLREKLIEENKEINWEPSYIRDGRFGEWLKDVKDWAISRERYWGTPLPLWQTEDGKEIIAIDGLQTLKKHVKKSGNKYFVMRHGEATNNVEGVLSSVKNKHPLTDEGRKQAEASAEKLKEEKIDIIFYSGILRTKETANIVREKLGEGVEFIEDPRLQEEDFGELSDVLRAKEFTTYFPSFAFRLDNSVGGCETLREAKKRIGNFLYDTDSKYQDKNILIVTHDGPASMTKVIAMGANDKEIEEVYGAGKDCLELGGFKEIEFSPIPHDGDYVLDLHKPYIDEIELETENGVKLKRVKEVMDVWFDSGAMPFATDVSGYPADFISEAIDQTRGWFYTLHAVGVLMGEGKAYKNVICLGHLNDKDGKKMSKSVGNVIDPWSMIEKYGVDALRLWMYSVNQPGEPKNFDEKTVDEIVKKNFNLLSNVLTFYELYRDESLESDEVPVSKNILDKWLLEIWSKLISESTAYLDGYKVLEPVRLLREFIEDLSTWYLQLSRDRFRDGDSDAKKTLYFILFNLSKFMAPFAPFYSESLYQTLKKESDPESVHLTDWPESTSEEGEIDSEMKKIRKIVSLGLEARQRNNINVRQPLRKITVKGVEMENEYKDLISGRLNVKEVLFDENLKEDVLLDIEISEALKEEGIGRELIRAIQDIRKKKGLTPKEIISLKIKTDETGKALLQKKEIIESIKKAVLADKLEIDEKCEGDEVKIDDLYFVIDVIK